VAREKGQRALGIAMPNYVDPFAFEGQPLMLKKRAHDDYAVTVADRVAGRIMAQARSGGRKVWFWTVTGPYLPDHLRPSNGDADTLDEAKAAFRAKFDKWLTWASTLSHQVVWNG
jgi:hypothetical protein